MVQHTNIKKPTSFPQYDLKLNMTVSISSHLYLIGVLDSPAYGYGYLVANINNISLDARCIERSSMI